MISDYDIDIKTRFIVLHLDANMKSTRMSDILQTPLRTIQDWMQKVDEGKDIRAVSQGRGREPKITKEEEHKILRNVREHPERSSTRKLGAKLEISKSTIHDIYVQKGLKYQSVRKIPKLTETQMDERIQYCLDMTSEDGQMIYETFFSDEMGIKLSDAYPRKVWGKAGDEMEIEKDLKEVKLNCWGVISSRGSTSLHIYQENLRSSLYQTILEKRRTEMDEIYPEGFYFVQDNHPVHQASENWLDENEFGRILFPDYSPDLTPMENLWSALKYAVACDAPNSESGLIRSLKSNWEKLTTPENLSLYFESLHSRYFECIEENGVFLPY